MADYSVTGNPISLSRGASSLIRVEFGLIQTAIATKVDNTGDTYTGTHDMTGATVMVATQSQGDNSTKPATTAYADTIKAYANSLSMAAGNMPVGGTTGQYLKKSSETNYDASWAALSITRSARTSNTILAAADSGTLIDITSGTFSQTFTAAATLASGWYCYIRNSGTGDITLEPDGAELIDGLTNYIMYPGEGRLVQCTGTAFVSVVLSPFSRAFTASGTFTKPPGYSYFGGLAWGGGSSGERTNNVSTLSRGGGGGGCFNFTLQASAVGTTETVTIGAGGAAVTTVAAGNVGGTTSFGSFVSLYGNTAASAGGSVYQNMTTASGSTSIPFGLGYEGSESGMSRGHSTVWGGGGASFDSSVASSGGSIYGGAAGGGLDGAATVRTPGTSKFGGNGGAALSTSNGVDGSAPGGGGGATQTGTSSGAGARGEVRIWGIA